MTRYGLHDEPWERIKDLLPGKPGDVGVTAPDNRRFVEAVLHRYRRHPMARPAGALWRLEEHAPAVQPLEQNRGVAAGV